MVQGALRGLYGDCYHIAVERKYDQSDVSAFVTYRIYSDWVINFVLVAQSV